MVGILAPRSGSSSGVSSEPGAGIDLTLHSAAQLDVSPGRWTVTTVTDDGVAARDPRAPSANQRHHLRTSVAQRAAGRRAPRWHAAHVVVDHMLDDDELGGALVSLARRHETLRSQLRVTGVPRAPEIVRDTHRGELLRAVTETFLEVGDGGGRALVEHLDAVLEPDAWPAFRMLHRVRDGCTELLLAFEPMNVDLYSIVLATNDVLRSLAGAPSVGPRVGSFVEYCAVESARSGLADDTHDLWEPFTRVDRAVLDLGLAAGESAPLTYVRTPLAGPAAAARLDRELIRLGADATAGVLALTAIATREVTGATTFCTVVPVATRLRPAWDEALGWFVEGLPLTLDLEQPDIDAAVVHARDRLYASAVRTHPPMDEALRRLGAADDGRRDRFAWTSYVDVRAITRTDPLGGHIRAFTRTAPRGDEIDLWFVRGQHGLAVDVRIPDTPAAHTTVDALGSEMRRALAQLVGADSA